MGLNPKAILKSTYGAIRPLDPPNQVMISPSPQLVNKAVYSRETTRRKCSKVDQVKAYTTEIYVASFA